MPSPSKTLKNVHRKQNNGLSLKAFARVVKDDKQHRDVVAAWLSNKAPKKKAAPAKPKPVDAAPAKPGNVLKKR
jgi:hypothetical protein